MINSMLTVFIAAIRHNPTEKVFMDEGDNTIILHGTRQYFNNGIEELFQDQVNTVFIIITNISLDTSPKLGEKYF